MSDSPSPTPTGGNERAAGPNRKFTRASQFMPRDSFLKTLGPGLVVAAAGIGAGDVITATVEKSLHEKF